MAPMPRPRKPYVQREKNRHGNTVWYFRRGDGPRVRLRGEYESREWQEEYERALAGIPAQSPASAKSSKGTFGWLIDQYMDSMAFAGLAPGTQKARRSILNRVKATGGKLLIEKITRGTIIAGRDRRRATPAAAVNFVKTMKAVFTWAVTAEHMTSNPCEDIKNTAPRTEGHHTWTVEQVRKFWEHHPLGTRPRLAMDLLLFTGMRSSDARLLGRQHVKDGWAHYRSVKTGIEVDLPILPQLQASIDAMPVQGLTFLLTEWGRPFSSAASFGNWFRAQCIAAGVPGRAHGLRKAGATICAENGASELQLMALFGWSDSRQAGVYTRKARRATLAGEAAKMLKIEQAENSLSPHLVSAVPAPK